jgi:membrane protease subunit HflK
MAEQDPTSAAAPAASGSAGQEALAAALKVCFRLLIGVLVGAILLYFWRSFFVVEQHEVGLVLRFGRLLGTTPQEQVRETGLHLTLPFPIDEKVRVPLKREQVVETMAFQPQASDEAPAAALRPGADGYLLTGDRSILHGKWVVRYTISDPIAYAFTMADSDGSYAQVRELLRCLLNGAVTETVGGLSMEQVWGQREQLKERVGNRLRQRVAAVRLGVEIRELTCELAPPRQVAEAFLAVNKAAVDYRRLMGEAEAAANATLTAAQSERLRLLSEAASVKADRERTAAAEATRFAALLTQYRENPAWIVHTRYDESMRRILSMVDERFLVQDLPGRELRLELNRQPDKPKAPTP